MNSTLIYILFFLAVCQAQSCTNCFGSDQICDLGVCRTCDEYAALYGSGDNFLYRCGGGSSGIWVPCNPSSKFQIPPDACQNSDFFSNPLQDQWGSFYFPDFYVPQCGTNGKLGDCVSCLSAAFVSKQKLGNRFWFGNGTDYILNCFGRDIHIDTVDCRQVAPCGQSGFSVLCGTQTCTGDNFEDYTANPCPRNEINGRTLQSNQFSSGICISCSEWGLETCSEGSVLLDCGSFRRTSEGSGGLFLPVTGFSPRETVDPYDWSKALTQMENVASGRCVRCEDLVLGSSYCDEQLFSQDINWRSRDVYLTECATTAGAFDPLKLPECKFCDQLSCLSGQERVECGSVSNFSTGSCQSCPIGKYSDGTTSCQSCPGDRTTAASGASSVAQCGCQDVTGDISAEACDCAPLEIITLPQHPTKSISIGLNTYSPLDYVESMVAREPWFFYPTEQSFFVNLSTLPGSLPVHNTYDNTRDNYAIFLRRSSLILRECPNCDQGDWITLSFWVRAYSIKADLDSVLLVQSDADYKFRATTGITWSFVSESFAVAERATLSISAQGNDLVIDDIQVRKMHNTCPWLCDNGYKYDGHNCIPCLRIPGLCDDRTQYMGECYIENGGLKHSCLECDAHPTRQRPDSNTSEYILGAQECTWQCKAGFYLDTADMNCYPCDITNCPVGKFRGSCKTNDAGTCQECTTKFVRNSQHKIYTTFGSPYSVDNCQYTCADGYFMSNDRCFQCNNRLCGVEYGLGNSFQRTVPCSEETNDNCIECQDPGPNAVITGSAAEVGGDCLTQCNSGFYRHECTEDNEIFTLITKNLLPETNAAKADLLSGLIYEYIQIPSQQTINVSFHFKTQPTNVQLYGTAYDLATRNVPLTVSQGESAESILINSLGGPAIVFWDVQVVSPAKGFRISFSFRGNVEADGLLFLDTLQELLGTITATRGIAYRNQTSHPESHTSYSIAMDLTRTLDWRFYTLDFPGTGNHTLSFFSLPSVAENSVYSHFYGLQFSAITEDPDCESLQPRDCHPCNNATTPANASFTGPGTNSTNCPWSCDTDFRFNPHLGTFLYGDGRCDYCPLPTCDTGTFASDCSECSPCIADNQSDTAPVFTSAGAINFLSPNARILGPQSCDFECPAGSFRNGYGCRNCSDPLPCPQDSFLSGCIDDTDAFCATCSPQCAPGFYTKQYCTNLTDRQCELCENSLHPQAAWEAPEVQFQPQCSFVCNSGYIRAGQTCVQCTPDCQYGFYVTDCTEDNQFTGCEPCPEIKNAYYSSNSRVGSGVTGYCSFECNSGFYKDPSIPVKNTSDLLRVCQPIQTTTPAPSPVVCSTLCAPGFYLFEPTCQCLHCLSRPNASSHSDIRVTVWKNHTTNPTDLARRTDYVPECSWACVFPFVLHKSGDFCIQLPNSTDITLLDSLQQQSRDQQERILPQIGLGIELWIILPSAIILAAMCICFLVKGLNKKS